MEHTDNLGAMAQKKKLETINTSTAQRNHNDAPCESRIDSKGKTGNGSCMQAHVDAICVESYEGSVDSYADGSWQIVNSKNSHN
jgi:hypothetical protein